MNLAELFDDHLRRYGEYPTLLHEDRWYTNKEMIDRAAQVAVGLAELGIGPGDRVATVLANCPEVLNVFGACFRMGAWAMPVLFTLTGQEMGFVFSDAEPKVVITQKLFLDKVLEARRNVPSIRAIITVDSAPVPDAVFMPGWFKNLPAEYPMAPVRPDDVALLMYTSGTTGAPKGVMLSHENLRFTGVASAEGQTLEDGEIGLSVLPLNHSYGIITSVAATQVKTSAVMLGFFDPGRMLQMIEQFKCNMTAVVPTMAALLLLHPESGKHDTSSMRSWVCAAAPLSAELRRRFEDKFSGKMYEGYGLTECSPTVAVNRPDVPVKDGSVGKPLPGVVVSIRSAADEEAPVGVAGEVCVKGKNVMRGYFKKPEATAAVIRNGWLRTGDVGRLDEDGYLYITERIKDMIIRGGENIYPRDIEEVLVTHPQVAEAAVIAMADEVYGEDVMAVVVPRPGASPDPQEIIRFCQDKLAKFQVPKRIELALFLPKSPIGKILKKELRKKYNTG